MVGPLRFYPPYTNGLVVHATFFCLVVGGLPLPTPLVVRPLKKNTFFYLCLPLRQKVLLVFYRFVCGGGWEVRVRDQEDGGGGPGTVQYSTVHKKSPFKYFVKFKVNRVH